MIAVVLFRERWLQGKQQTITEAKQGTCVVLVVCHTEVRENYYKCSSFQIHSLLMNFSGLEDFECRYPWGVNHDGMGRRRS